MDDSVLGLSVRALEWDGGEKKAQICSPSMWMMFRKVRDQHRSRMGSRPRNCPCQSSNYVYRRVTVEEFGSTLLQVQFELEHKLTPRKSLR